MEHGSKKHRKNFVSLILKKIKKLEDNNKGMPSIKRMQVRKGWRVRQRWIVWIWYVDGQREGEKKGEMGENP